MNNSFGKRLLNNLRKDGYYVFYTWLMGKYTQLYKPELSKRNAMHVTEMEWDSLIVLDACRFDMFQEIVDPKADSVISGGSDTREWIQWNFNRRLDDIVYVAGNPHLAKGLLLKMFGFVPFHKVIDAWDFGWDDRLKTVPPEVVTKSALEAAERYPEKRLIIHYNQPHHPFIGDENLLAWEDGPRKNLEEMMTAVIKTTVWDLARHKQVPLESIWKGYRENLKIVMKEVHKLAEVLDGKLIVTSDHGNHIGEMGLYGHIPHVRSMELVRVPWYTMKPGERTTPPEPRTTRHEHDHERDRIRQGIRSLITDGQL